MAAKPTRLAFCPHCHSKSKQRLVFSAPRVEEFDEGQYYEETYYIAICQTCDDLILLHEHLTDDAPEDHNFWSASVLWPDAGQLHKSIPKVIRECYAEAQPIRDMAPNAFAVQVRRALEFLTIDQGAKGKNLGEKITWLAEQGKIPGALSKMTEALRILGNIGAHASEERVTKDDARAIDGFFRSLTEYVYVAPAKLQEYEKRTGKP